jgi:tetratricopeptide (TPR) repeat protein
VGPKKLVEDLRKDLAAGHVLVVVGTGVSLQASGGDGRAGWAGLIGNGIDSCDGLGLLGDGEAKQLHERLKDAKAPAVLIEIAERIQSLLDGAGELRRWLQESAGALPLPDREIVDAVHALGARISTTNYDDLLSRDRGIHAVPWTDLIAVQELLRGDRRGILHFHGYYDAPESVILGVRSYKALLEAKGAQAVQQVVAASQTLLFVGCGSDGLADPNFGALLEWCATVFPDSRYRHYCLCRKGELASLKAKHKGLSFIAYGKDYADLAPALRALAPLSVPSATLPPPGHCFGRTREVRTLVKALSRKQPDPIAILGGPGMGKTTISLKAMHEPGIAKCFGARRWFVRCDGVKTRAELAAAIARVLGIAITPNLEPQVLAELMSGRAALVLDNAETPLDADREPVEALLSAIASIESLALVVTIRGKARPPAVAWGATLEVKPLIESAAQEAFIAASGKPKFAGDPHLPPLLSVLEGVPLAITLMGRFAQRFNALDLVWERWSAKKTAMLSAGADRLTNIEISYELSIGALSPEARRLLSVLAILPAGVAHLDLPAIYADPDQAADELRDRALIEDEENRIRMLAPLREHVAAAHPPEAADEERAIGHFLTLADKDGRKVGYVGGAEAVARLAPEVANVEAMLVRSAGQTPERAARAAYGWSRFMYFTGLGSTSAIERVLERALAAGLTQQAAKCSISLGEIALAHSDHDTARKRYEEAMPLYRKVGDVLGEANCISSLGDIALERSEHDTARERYEEAMPLYRKVGDVLGEANCIKGLGNIALERSEHDTARERYEEAMPLYRKVGDVLGEANCIRSLGDIALERSEHDTARERYEEALPLYRKVGAVLGEANCIQSLGDIALRRSEHDTARERYEEAMPLYRKVGDVLGEANCIRSLGDIALERSEHDTARERYEEAMPLYRKVGAVLGEANCIRSLGDIARDAGNAGEAESRYRQALALYARIPEPYSIGETHRRLARLATGDAGARKVHVDAAREAWRRIKRDDLVAKLDAELGGE